MASYTYDATGNRLSETIGPGAAVPYTYFAGSHRLESVDGTERTYDENGNTRRRDDANRSTPTFHYDERNRFSGIFSAATAVQYLYNARGERVAKRINGGGVSSRDFVYDEGGRLLAELNQGVAQGEEYVWLDDLPVGLVNKGIYHLQSDHLGTPRKAIKSTTNTAVWHWPIIGNPFGELTPDEDPDADTYSLTINLRFPGQFYDAESGLHYNYFRDYEPSIGRYLGSDPVGLRGGVNTYSYVFSSPMLWKDPFGLDVLVCRDPAFNGSFGPMKHFWIKTDLQEGDGNRGRGRERW